MKYILISFCAVLFISTSCKKKKERIEFTLKSLTLKAFEKESLPEQNVYLKVLQEGTVLAETYNYPSKYTLPAKFGLEQSVQMNFYKNDYTVELWGDSSGYIGSNPIHLEDYKIIYPLDMETENNGIEIVLSGTWK